MLIAVASWIIFTLPVGFIHPPVVCCKYYSGPPDNWTLREPNLERRGNLIEVPVRKRRSLEEQKTYHIVNGQTPRYERLTPDTVAELPRALPFTMDLASPPLDKRRTRL